MLIGSCSFVSVHHAGAQTLGGAAQKAEEQRRADPRAPITITQVDAPPLREMRLGRVVVDNYVNARVAMAKLWQRNRPIYERVAAGGRGVERLRDFARVLEAEPEIVELLKFYHFTPESMVVMELTLRRALARTEGGYGKLTDIERENSADMGKDLAYVQYAVQRYYKQEAGLHAWPEWLPY
jgi:hypothetical protein